MVPCEGRNLGARAWTETEKWYVNPLTTDDAIWHRLTLATCYQMVQSILKIGFVLAKKVG